jgi:hypothetical protein
MLSEQLTASAQGGIVKGGAISYWRISVYSVYLFPGDLDWITLQLYSYLYTIPI